jgi:hypothetical protein
VFIAIEDGRAFENPLFHLGLPQCAETEKQNRINPSNKNKPLAA